MTGVRSAAQQGVIWGYLSQATSMVLSVISLRLLIGYFDQELFSIWTIIAGLIGYLSLSTLGIPTAASVIAAKTLDNRDKFEILKKSFKWLLAFSLIVLTAVYYGQQIFPSWISIFGGISDSNSSISKQAALIMAYGMLLRAPFSLSFAGFSAQQRIDIVKKYELLTIVTAYISLVLTIEIGGSLVSLAWYTSSSAFVITLISFIHYLLRYSDASSEAVLLHEYSYKGILNSGLSYFQIGLASMLVWASDAIIISNLMTSVAVAPYAIAFRLYSMGFILFTMINGVLIPSIGKAKAAGEWLEIKHIYRLQVNLLPILAGAVWIGGILIASPIIELWTGRDDMFGGYPLIFIFGFYGFILCHVSIHSSLMTAFNYSSLLSKIAWGEAVIKIILSILLVQIIGISGAVLGTVLASVFIPLLALPSALTKLTEGKLTASSPLLVGKQLATLLPFLLLAVIGSTFFTDTVVLCLLVFVLLGAYFIVSYFMLDSEIKPLILGSQIFKILISRVV